MGLKYIKFKNYVFKRMLDQALRKEPEDIFYLLTLTEEDYNKIFSEYESADNSKNKSFEEYFLEHYKIKDHDTFYDLIGLYFEDEKRYNRALFYPVPLLDNNTLNKIFDMIEQGKIKVVSRVWHDSFVIKYQKPDTFRPIIINEYDIKLNEYKTKLDEIFNVALDVKGYIWNKWSSFSQIIQDDNNKEAQCLSKIIDEYSYFLYRLEDIIEIITKIDTKKTEEVEQNVI